MFEQNQEIYKVSQSTGKIQVWKAWCDGNKVLCMYGQLDGKMQIQEYEAFGKNIGRSNETTNEEQAFIEMQAMYQSQIDNKHYKLSIEEAKEASKQCFEPRKITNYKDRYNKMSDILLTSVKKNGSRACVIEGDCYSKIGRPEEIKVNHLRAFVEELGIAATFDAEVFAEGLSLQRIRSAWLKPVKTDKEIIKIAKDRAKSLEDTIPQTCGLGVSVINAVNYLGYNPNDDAHKLKFFIFDIPTTQDITFRERIKLMHEFEDYCKNLKLDVYFEMLYPVETNSHEERMKMLQIVVAEGNEGLVHYEPKGVYEFGKRSTNTCKSKPRYDSEACIIDVTKDKSGQGVLHLKACDQLGNVKFKAKMKGDAESRSFDNQKQLIGKWITFSYEELSDKGVPTKPVGEQVRDCDFQGNPLN